MIELNGSGWLRNDTNKLTNAGTITTSFLVLFLSLMGNLLVVAVFYRNKTLRTPVHYFIVNMAISDLIIPVVVLPLVIAKEHNDSLWMLDEVILFFRILCIFETFVFARVCFYKVSKLQLAILFAILFAKEMIPSNCLNVDHIYNFSGTHHLRPHISTTSLSIIICHN